MMPFVLSLLYLKLENSPVSYPCSDISKSEIICISDRNTLDSLLAPEPVLGSNNDPKSDLFVTSKLTKKKALFFMIGPPIENPDCMEDKSPVGTSVSPILPPVIALFLKNPYTVPSKLLFPDFVTALIEAPVNPD